VVPDEQPEGEQVLPTIKVLALQESAKLQVRKEHT
jgi:hypothetical protein